jgi:VanZ family protein
MSKKPLSNSNLLQQWPWIASMILMLLIFYFSSIPGEEVSQYNDVIIRESVTILPQNTPTFFLRDTSWLKSGHVIGYGLLGITLFLGFSQYYKLSLVLSTLTALLYAVSDEIHQSFVPGRSGSIVDVVLDTAAAFLCAGLLNLVFFVIQRIKITRKS